MGQGRRGREAINQVLEQLVYLLSGFLPKRLDLFVQADARRTLLVHVWNIRDPKSHFNAKSLVCLCIHF